MDHRSFHQGGEWWSLNLPTLHLCREFLSQIRLKKFIKGDSAIIIWGTRKPYSISPMVSPKASSPLSL